MERTPVQEYLHTEYEKAYQQRHQTLADSGEVSLINSFVPKVCPYCESVRLGKTGFTRNGIQRYRCYACGKTFTPVTGTIFEGHKIAIREWMDYTLNIVSARSNSGLAPPQEK